MKLVVCLYVLFLRGNLTQCRIAGMMVDDDLKEFANLNNVRYVHSKPSLVLRSVLWYDRMVNNRLIQFSSLTFQFQHNVNVWELFHIFLPPNFSIIQNLPSTFAIHRLRYRMLIIHGTINSLWVMATFLYQKWTDGHLSKSIKFSALVNFSNLHWVSSYQERVTSTLHVKLNILCYSHLTRVLCRCWILVIFYGVSYLVFKLNSHRRLCAYMCTSMVALRSHGESMKIFYKINGKFVILLHQPYITHK